MSFIKYRVTLRHDAGKVRISVVAARMTQAVRLVLNSEAAPFGAVVKIERLGEVA